MKLPPNSASRLPGPSGNQLEKVHGKSEERYSITHYALRITHYALRITPAFALAFLPIPHSALRTRLAVALGWPWGICQHLSTSQPVQ
jgi:hypothetical protein